MAGDVYYLSIEIVVIGWPLRLYRRGLAIRWLPLGGMKSRDFLEVHFRRGKEE